MILFPFILCPVVLFFSSCDTNPVLITRLTPEVAAGLGLTYFPDFFFSPLGICYHLNSQFFCVRGKALTCLGFKHFLAQVFFNCFDCRVRTLDLKLVLVEFLCSKLQLVAFIGGGSNRLCNKPKRVENMLVLEENWILGSCSEILCISVVKNCSLFLFLHLRRIL